MVQEVVWCQTMDSTESSSADVKKKIILKKVEKKDEQRFIPREKSRKNTGK